MHKEVLTLQKPGASIPPETMMHFPLCFRFPPYFRKIFGLSENFYNFTFSRKISSLSSAKISDDFFFSHRPQMSNSPLFSLFQYISPLFRENYFPPYFDKFPPCFTQIHLLFTYFTCISLPPYFYHDAFMHHPMHLLDAPGHFIVNSKCSQHFSVFTPLFHSRTSKFTTTTAQLPFYNFKLHFTTAEIVISCTLKYALRYNNTNSVLVTMLM